MTIKYTLYQNHLPTGANSYRARVDYQQVIELEELLEYMNFRNSSVTRADMLAVFEDLQQTLLRLLLQGVRIVTPFGEFGLTIKGNFEGSTDHFDPHRHRIELILKPGEPLEREFKRQAKAQKKQAAPPHPIPADYTNLADPAAKTQLAPGRMARLTGDHLKFNPADSRQGLFLIPLQADNPAQTAGPAIRVGEVGSNKGRQLLFVVPPDLTPGPYRLEVRAVFGKDTLRTGQLSETLLVPE